VGPGCLLLLTWLTPLVVGAVQVLGIPGGDAVVREPPLRDNLRLRVMHVNGGSAGGAISAQVVGLLTTGGGPAAGSGLTCQRRKPAVCSAACCQPTPPPQQLQTSAPLQQPSRIPRPRAQVP
jgi:hypothetical protein